MDRFPSAATAPLSEKPDGQQQNMATFKVVIVGDMNVGKTCLLKRYINNSFNEGEDATLGATFYSKKLRAEYQIKEKNDDAKSMTSASSRP